MKTKTMKQKKIFKWREKRTRNGCLCHSEQKPKSVLNNNEQSKKKRRMSQEICDAICKECVDNLNTSAVFVWLTTNTDTNTLSE